MKIHITRKQIVLSTLGTALLTVSGTYLAARLLERALAVPVNAYIRDRTLAFLQEKTPDGLVITFPKLDLSLVRRRLVIHDLKIRYDHKDSTRYERFQANVPEIVLNGVDLKDVLWHRHLRLDAVRLSRPVLSRLKEISDTTVHPGKPVPQPAASEEQDRVNADSLTAQIPALDTVVYNLFATWLPDDFRQARIDLVAAESATIVTTSKKGSRISRDSTEGLTLRVRGIQLDSTNRRIFTSAYLSADTLVHLAPGLGDSVRIEGLLVRLDPEDTVVAVNSLRTIPADSGQALYIGGFKRAHRGRSFSIDSIAYVTLRPDSAVFAQPGRRSRVRVSVSGVHATGVEAAALPRGQAVVHRLDVDSILIDAVTDTRLETPPRPRQLWPQVLANLKWRIAIDTLHLGHGHIRYGELKTNRPEAAVVWFSNISATITGLGNHPESTHVAGPAVLVGKAQFMGQGTINTRLEVPVTPDRFAMRAEGRLEAMPAEAVNRFLLTAMGVRITSGRIHHATFAFQVVNDSAHGRLALQYDSLGVEIVDKSTHKKGLDEKLKTFIAKNMMVRGSNLPDKNGKLDSAPISYRYKPGENFWGGIWRSLRSGLTKTIKK